ncbi:Ig-like domain repeat protein [Methanobrevibacter smithii]|uniref:Ig-like domain repeat protein n=5 Tax=Methanobrevibacter smithii TaxID=2173 RepID=UPI0037DDD8C4
MDKKILIIFLIAIVAFSISCVSAADSNEIVMNSSDAVGISEDVSVDDGAFANPVTSEDSQVVGDPSSDGVWVATTGSDDNDGSQASPVASVSKAVDLAQSGSTIHIKEGTYNQGKISLNKTLSFVGEGNVILSSNGANVFACEKDGYNLEFTNLVFTGVSSTAGTSCGLKVGGNGNLKVINCTFTDISAKYGAMQLYTTGVADIINSTIKDVVSGTSNGCIVYISGSGTYNFNNLSIINPKLADSVVAGSPYAFLRNVFYSYGKEATVTLTNSIITGASGPIQAVVESRGKLTIYNTVISNNVVGKTTTSYGKYLLYVGEVTALNMTNCIIENNTFADSSSALIYFNSACKANITYSSIVDNGFSKNVDVKYGITPTVNLDYNWWGTNTYTGDNVNKWVVMSTPETTINAESGKAIDVSVNFNHYTDASGSIQDLAQSISGINVDFSAVSGTLSKNNVASVDGIATVTYTTTTNDKITAKSGSQSLTIDVVAKQAAADIWVATIGSDDNDGSQANPVATIAKAIELAGDGYTIHIADGNYVNDKTLSISKSLTLEGSANTVIDGNASKIMEVTADATVVLTNLSFTNGNDALVGAISNEGKLTISNSNFYSNKVTGNSGTIITNKNKLNINNSKFYQNSAGRGVVNNQNDAVLVIDNSEFYNNDMTSFSNSYGIVYTTSSNATISNTVFRNNAAKWGGAIYATKSSGATIGIVNIINSTFESNSANTGQGGALFVSGGECIVKESMFINNKANPGKFSGGQGGAIYTSLNGNVSVTDSVFKNNQAKLGAALYLNGGSNSTISYSVLLDNVAEGDYAISNAESASGVATVNYNWWGTNSPKNLVPSTVTLNNWVIMSADPTTVTDAEIGDVKTISVNFNKYSSFGAIKDLSKPLPAIDVEFSAVNGTLTSNLVSTVDGVAAVSYTVNGNDQITAKSGSQTLTIEVVAKLPVTDVWVSSTGSDDNDGSQDNPVATIAKAIELVAEGYTIHVGEGTYIANSLTIAKSFAMIGSGKVIIDGNASKIMNINENTIVNFTNVAFTNALNNYGGVMQSKGTVNLNNVSIYKNTQKSGSTPTVSSIYNTGVMTIINSNIYENDGYGLIFNSGNLDIINTTISSNNVAKGTTYAFLYADGGVVNVINSTISDNTARLAGIWLNKGTLNVNNATFENNVVTVGNGGAIHIESDSSTATIKDSKFIGNKANKDGGAIYNKGTLNIETSIFDANAASNGNTGYHGDDIYNSGILTLHYSALLGKGTNKLIYNEGREPSANAQYNWWGTNSNPSTLVGAGLDYDDEPCDDVDVSNWVVMSVDPASIENANIGDEKTLTVNFNHYNANGVIKELTKAIPSVAVSFEAVNGTLAGNIISTVDGVASVTYTVNGNDQITVTSGSQSVNIDVTVKQIVTDVWVSASGSNANDGSQANPVATIAKAVELVKPGYTIHVMDGTYTVSDLAINFNVAIIGENEVTFTGDTKTMFTVANGIAFNLTNLNITGINRGTSNYGVIYNKGGSVYLNKINAYSNTANQGAVVYSDKGSVNIVDSEFRANSGTVGVIYANAANVVMNNSKIYDSTFSGNGVIYGSGSSVIDLSNVDISNNKMTGNALIGLAGTELTISDSYVHNNTLSSGAIFYGASSDNVINIRYSIFGDNTVNKGFAYCLLGTFKADISDSIIISNEGTTFDALIGTISGTIDNNWWGTNSPKTGKLTPSKWVVLTATSNFTESLKAGEVIGITAGLNTLRDAAGNNYTLGDTDIFDGWNVEINGEKATVKDGKATVLYTLTSGENVIPVKADSETLTLTYNVGSSTTNIVTNDTFFNFFDNAGTLLESITFDTLIFKGEFLDLGVNVVYVPRAITINGDNAVLRNIAIMCEQGTVLNNLTLNATNYVADTDGALIYAIGSDVTVNNITIDYNATDGSKNAIAVYASGADNFKLVNSTIIFTGNNVNGKVFAQGIKIAKSNNAVVDSNIITTSCPLVDVDYSHWGSIDTDLVFAIGVEKSENVKIINNVVDNSAWTKGNGANFPTFDAFIAHTANNLLIKNNTISHTDLITPKGTSSYIYALDFYESNNVTVEDNRVLLNTTGGKEGAGAAYAVQVTGPYNNFVVRGNNLTTVSNGPNLAVYSQNYYGTTEITVENNWINVTGFAGPADFALVSGMEFQDTVAKAYNNTIYVQNVNEYNDNNNIAGITYVQSTSGSHKFDIQNNTIYSEGKYAVLIKSAENSQIIGNTLYAHELKGDDAAIFKSGTNNIIKDNKPMTFVSDIIIDVNNVWIGKEAVIGVTLNSTATGSVNITVGGKTYTVSLTDGKATLKVSDLVAGVNTVVVNYYGDDNFKYSTNSTTFKVLDGVVTNETFFDYFINGTLADYVPEGATLDFRGKFYSHDDVKFDLAINKPINMISSTKDAFIDLNTTAGSLLGENPGSCFTINNGGSGSNVSGIIFHNTQVWIYDAHNVVLNNISVIVENKRVGSGVGTTAIRHGSTNVTIKNSYIYTSNNGGSSSIVLTHVQNCTVENNTIVGEGNVGNLLYLNTFNDADCDLSNDYNKIINNKITGPSPAAGICYGIGINGNNNLIAGNVINYAGNGIVPAWGATPNNNTYCDNVLIGGASMSVAASSIAYNNTVSGTLTIGSDSVAYNNTAKAISVSSNSVVSNSSATATLTVQAGAKVANVTAASLSVNGKNAVIENVSISGVGTIKSSATNTTLINSTFGGMLTVQSAKNTIKYNNIVLATGDAAILATGGDNVITNNYLIAGDKLGDNAVNSTVETNIVKDNLPGGIVNVTITAKDVFEGSDVIIDVTVDSLSNLTEKFMLKINNKEYVLSFTDSKANVTISDLTAGKYDIAVTYGDETYTLINATSDVSVYGNVVTNETFFIYFDEDGLLREEVPFDELIFKGEFSDIVNLISITTPLKITSDNAVLRNIAFAVLSDNVVLNGLTLISNVSCADNGGALILVAGNNVNVSNMNISYIIKESVDAVAINANGVSNLNVVNSNIFFESCPKDDTLTACVINIDGVSNSFINGNNITAVLPYLFASNYDMKYFMMGVNTVNPIRMRECNNVTFSKNNVNTTANDGSASFPTLQCMFIVGSNDCVIDGNNFSMIDTLIPAGTSNYLYGINIGYNKNLMISNNDFKMSTAGGKDAAGTAYAIQGVECEVSMIGNNITSISNGPNLGIYFASMTGGTSELYIANNLINVTGLASASGSWALVSGIEVQNGNAKIYNNTIYTYNVGDYSPENYMYGISYAQYMYGDRSFDIRDNRIYVDGHYAVSFINVDGSNVTGNLLITRNLGGDAAVEIKAGKNNVVENNYPRSSDLIFNITSEEPGKILIDVTIDKKATGNIAVIVDGDKYDVAIVNGSAKLTLSDLPAGVYYIEAKYDGNSIVTESYNSTKFTIDLIDSSIAVEAKNIKCGEEAVITATVTDGATGTVTFFVNGKTYVVDITDSVATLKIADLTTGDYPVFAYYNGDKYYKTSYNSTTFNVAKLASTTTVNVSDIKVGEDAVIDISVPEITSGVVSVTVGDAIYNVAVVDGKGTLTLSGLASGSYDVVAKFNGDDKYLASEDSAKFNVTKLASTIDIAVDNIKVGEDAVIGVALPEDATGEVIISVNGKNYTVMTKYGMASVTISDLANGTYSVDAFYNGDDIYAPIKNSTAFTVSKVSDYNMTVDIADIVKGENATITVSVPEDGTGNVIVTINGTDYKGTVVNGTAKVIIPGLDEGTYKVVTFYTGDNKYDSMIVNGTITVNKNTKTTLTMDNLVKYFNGPQKLMAKLVDGFGNPIANATVYFTINGKVYARITDENGTASIAIRLLPSEYKASALFNGTDDYDMAAVNASVLVKNTILGNDTTLYFRNGTQYVAKFLDGNGKALANTDVKFNINGVFYTRVTDENGIARLNIRLDPASYIITAYNPVTGEQKANNITVLPRIIAKDLSMKYLDGSTFNAALVDGQGKAISGVNITFNINGVFYHRTTNADGVTKLNIRLMPGEYIITSMYDECWASNKIIISA